MNWPIVIPIAIHATLGTVAWIASYRVKPEWRVTLKAAGIGMLLLLDIQLVGAGLAFVTTCEFGACQ